MRKPKVLFICIHNSARSQMAEAFFNALCGSEFEAHSAGIEPGVLNPLAVEVMKEVGIDVSAKVTQSVFERAKKGELFAYVVSVCDEAGERCPIFPGVTKRLAWSFADPSSFEGTWDEKVAKTRVVRDEIKAHVAKWCATVCHAEASRGTS